VIVLDTAAWVWWVSDPARLSARACRAIEVEEERHGLVVSVISVWEVGVKVALRKLVLDRDVRAWVELASSYPGILVQPLSAVDALESTLLPRWLGVALVTRDRAIRAYRYVSTIW
jgi:PIN domain nuclease of toxin-antitoxin system